MPWATSTRRSRLPSNWQSLRLRVLQRDGYVCQQRDAHGRKCLAPANQCDHIVPGDDHSLGNLQALCLGCHKIKTAAEASAARGNLRRLRPEETHPADL